MSKWNINSSDVFWSKRPFHSIVRDDNLNQRKSSTDIEAKARQQRHSEDKGKFFQEYNLSSAMESCNPLPGAKTVSDLKFWMEHLSWTYCNKCKTLITQRLLPNYFKRPPLKYMHECLCNKCVYMNPTLNMIPEVLRGLSYVELIALQPFTVHLGDYCRKQNGYRQKTSMFRLTWSKTSIIDNIHKLEDQNSIQRCNIAYEYLMQNSSSSYKHFVNLRELAMKDNEKFNVYNFQQNSGIECALWPVLYPETHFCEMTLNGRNNHASSKVAFMSFSNSTMTCGFSKL